MSQPVGSATTSRGTASVGGSVATGSGQKNPTARAAGASSKSRHTASHNKAKEGAEYASSSKSKRRLHQQNAVAPRNQVLANTREEPLEDLHCEYALNSAPEDANDDDDDDHGDQQQTDQEQFKAGVARRQNSISIGSTDCRATGESAGLTPSPTNTMNHSQGCQQQQHQHHNHLHQHAPTCSRLLAADHVEETTHAVLHNHHRHAHTSTNQHCFNHHQSGGARHMHSQHKTGCSHQHHYGARPHGSAASKLLPDKSHHSHRPHNHHHHHHHLQTQLARTSGQQAAAGAYATKGQHCLPGGGGSGHLHGRAAHPHPEARHFREAAAKLAAKVVAASAAAAAAEAAAEPRPKPLDQAATTPTTSRAATTVKFISQLYFLIHLSAMISLLLHHKNLVASERRLALQQQQHQLHLLAIASGNNEQQLHYVTSPTKRNIQQQQQQQQQHNQQIGGHQTAPPPPPASNRSLEAGEPAVMLPEPQMLQAPTSFSAYHRPSFAMHNFTPSLAPPPPPPTLNQRRGRSNRQQDEIESSSSLLNQQQQQQQHDARSSDILVRLVGRLHAKCALQYFLCYLLSSSITVLIFLWLIRLFTQHRAAAPLQVIHVISGASSAAAAAATSQLVEQRNLSSASSLSSCNKSSRQDCTPVLIGSISLGLIQLIVIGLDIADNVDWLASASSKGADLARQWPILLPFLQFCFVSLLMQFILAQVAKNRDSSESVANSTISTTTTTTTMAPLVTVPQSKVLGGIGGGSGGNKQLKRRRPAGDKVQNIALAHLLVTHILLWLMRLNSISLFQANEPQVFLVSPFGPLRGSAPPPSPPPPPTSSFGPFNSRPIDLSSSSQSGAAVNNNGNDMRQYNAPTTANDLAQTTPATTTTSSTTTGQPRDNGPGGQSNSSAGGSEPATRRPPSGETTSTTTTTTPMLAGNRAANDPLEVKEPRLISMMRPTPVDGAGGGDSKIAQSGGDSNANATKNERDLRSTGETASTRSKSAATTTNTTTGSSSSTTRRPPDDRLVKNTNYIYHDDDGDDVAVDDATPPPRQKKIAPTYRPASSSPPPPLPANSVAATGEAPTPRLAGGTIQQKPPSPNSSGLGVELRQPNIPASVFKSSLPKRMTAFRQGRPSQRVNLTQPNSSTTTTRSTSTTTKPEPSTATATTTSTPAPRTKHKVRVFVSRDDSSDSNSIDLTAVIPAPGPSRDSSSSSSSSEAEDDSGEPEAENAGADEEASKSTRAPAQHAPPSPSVARSPATSTTTTRQPQSGRPFPSVDEDPPPARPTRLVPAAALHQHDHKLGAASFVKPIKERKPSSMLVNGADSPAPSPLGSGAKPNQASGAGDDNVARKRKTAPVVVASEKPPGNKKPSTPFEASEAPQATAEYETGEEEEGGGGELDLDSLLPPVPNYDNLSSNSSDPTTTTTVGSSTNSALADDTDETTPSLTNDDDDEAALGSLLDREAQEQPTTRRRADSRERNKVAIKTSRAPTIRPRNETERQLALLDEEAFVFNEAASDQHNSTAAAAAATAATVKSNGRSLTSNNSASPRLDSIAKLALTASGNQHNVPQAFQLDNAQHSDHWHQQQTRDHRHQQQQQQQQQPTFTEFLLPIVQQYHILVLTILFNMWLDSMQRAARVPTGQAAVAAASTVRQSNSARSSEAGANFGQQHVLMVNQKRTRRPIAMPRGQGGAEVNLTRSSSLSQLSLSGRTSAASSLGSSTRQLVALEQRYKQAAVAVAATRRGHPRRSSGAELDPQEELIYLRQRASAAVAAARSLDHLDCLSQSQDSDSEGGVGGGTISSIRNSLAGQEHQLVGRQRPAFWYDDKRRRSLAHQRLLRLNSSLDQPGGAFESMALHQQHHQHRKHPSSACSIFFGLLVVSASFIVILLNIDLLSALTQCAIQLVSILACLLGLCCIWRLKKSLEARSKSKTTTATTTTSRRPRQRRRQTTSSQASELLQQVVATHKSSFHYLFLLAAYYCGISIALNLGQQYHLGRLFPQQVVKFIQRNLSQQQQQRHFVNDDTGALAFASSPTTAGSYGGNESILSVISQQQQQHQHQPDQPTDSQPVRMINFQLLFHALLILKGLVLIVQVTVQTILIRISWSWPFGRCELRQLYNFLMFTNLSLWALEICDQQQQMQLIKQQQQQQQQQTLLMVGQQHQQAASHQLFDSSAAATGFGQNFELLTLDGFTRFAGSVVTLSHLYHGLVFMQH